MNHFCDSEALMPDPASDVEAYPIMRAWSPRRLGLSAEQRLRRARCLAGSEFDMAVRSEENAVAEAQSLRLRNLKLPPKTPAKCLDASPGEGGVMPGVRGNLVSQSAFLLQLNAQPLVTDGTITQATDIAGETMNKSDFFSARARPLNAAVAPASHDTTVTAEPTVDQAGFVHSVPPLFSNDRLDMYGSRWLQSMPVAVRPLITAKRHPHIINRFALLWTDREALNRYFDELFISSRPGRKGFAMEVLDELAILQRAVHEKKVP